MLYSAMFAVFGLALVIVSFVFFLIFGMVHAYKETKKLKKELEKQKQTRYH